MGDVLWIEPLIRQLANSYSKVIVHTLYNELFENYPLSNVVFRKKLNVFEKIAARLRLPFFITLDQAYEKEPHMHLLHAYQKAARLPLTNEYPHIYLTEAEKKNYAGERPYVVLNLFPESYRNFRKVYGVDWEEVVAFLQAQSYKVIYIGQRSSTIPGVIYYDTSIREMLSLIYNAKLFIGIDSGPSHIAASLSVPSLLFFGSVNPVYRHFASLFKGQIMQKPCEFAGCYHEAKEGAYGTTCRLVGDSGIPKCTLHSTENVTASIQSLLSSIK